MGAHCTVCLPLLPASPHTTAQNNKLEIWKSNCDTKRTGGLILAKGSVRLVGGHVNLRYQTGG